MLTNGFGNCQVSVRRAELIAVPIVLFRGKIS